MPKFTSLTPRNVDILFDKPEEEGLRVFITTPSYSVSKNGKEITVPGLIIRSAGSGDLSNYIALFGDAEVMRTYAKGVPITDESKIASRLKMYEDRWDSDNPFSGFAIYDASNGNFLGHIAVGQNSRGVAEVGYIIAREYWGRYVGTTAAIAIIDFYVPRVMMRRYTLLDKPLEKVVATARGDNIGSQRILETAGLETDGKAVESLYSDGVARYWYQALAAEIKRAYHQHFLREELESRPRMPIDDELLGSAFGAGSNTATRLLKNQTWRQRVQAEGEEVREVQSASRA